MIGALNPTIVNDEFYFSVNISRLPYYKSLWHGKDTIFEITSFRAILQIWTTLFQPYKKFKKNKNKILNTIGSFKQCHNFCPCINYKNIPFYKDPLI